MLPHAYLWKVIHVFTQGRHVPVREAVVSPPAARPRVEGQAAYRRRANVILGSINRLCRPDAGRHLLLHHRLLHLLLHAASAALNNLYYVHTPCGPGAGGSLLTTGARLPEPPAWDSNASFAVARRTYDCEVRRG